MHYKVETRYDITSVSMTVPQFYSNNFISLYYMLAIFYFLVVLMNFISRSRVPNPNCVFRHLANLKMFKPSPPIDWNLELCIESYSKHEMRMDGNNEQLPCQL